MNPAGFTKLSASQELKPVPQERPDDAEIPITVQQPPAAAASTDEDKRAAGEDKRAAGEDKRAGGGDNVSQESSDPAEKQDVTRFSFFEKNFGGEEIVISVKPSDSDDGFEEGLDEPKAQEEESQSRDDSKSSYRMPTF
jgi:hypothetical protein